MKLAIALITVAITAAAAQSWRLSSAQATIDHQQQSMQLQEKQLVQKNSQLIALSLLTEANSREQTRLLAVTEKNGVLLRKRQRRLEELTCENDHFRRWADTPLPDAVIRLRSRPLFTGGEPYREWLSENHPLHADGIGAAP